MAEFCLVQFKSDEVTFNRVIHVYEDESVYEKIDSILRSYESSVNELAATIKITPLDIINLSDVGCEILSNYFSTSVYD